MDENHSAGLDQVVSDASSITAVTYLLRKIRQ